MSGVRRWGGYLAVVIIFAIGCGLLSWWQFARRDEAVQRIETVERNWDAAPVSPSDELLPSEPLAQPLTWTPVEFHGTYLIEDELLVRGRPYQGNPGFEVLTPLLLDDDRIVIINRGWVPVANDRDAPAFVPAAPEGEVTVIARMKAGEPEIPGRGAPEDQVATIHLPTIAALVAESDHATAETEIVTGAFGLMDSEDPAASEDRPRPSIRPVADEGSHLSYALQWIVFGLMAVAALVWAYRQDLKVRRGEPVAKRPKRNVDELAEDAALDA